MSRPAPLTRQAWMVTSILAATVWLGVFGLTTMLETDSWRVTLGLTLAVVALCVSITRALGRSRVLPTLAGALASVLLLVPLFAAPVDPFGELGRRWLPTPPALADLGRALREGVHYASTTVAPAPVTDELLALVTVGALLLFLTVDHLAVSWRLGATSGLLLLLPWMPAVFFQHRISTVALLTAIGAWLVVVALTRRPGRAGRQAALGPAVIGASAAVAVGLVVAPTALGGVGWGSIPRFEAPGSFSATTRLNLALDLRTSLTTNAANPVLTYSTDGARPDTFRLYALSEFDGAAWERGVVDAPATAADSGVLWPVPVDDFEQGNLTELQISVLNLAETNLPVPASPRAVSLGSPWGYDPARDEIVTDTGSTLGLSYSVISRLDYLDKDELRAAQDQIDSGRDLADPRYLELASAMDSDSLRELSQEVTEATSTRYDQAMAIQTFLRDANRFTYDTSVNPGGRDAVATFLEDGRGYCVQYATTMAMMARSLDIPARIAVGFLSSRAGSGTGGGDYVVYGADAHAWPELWFPDQGWVRFEPTPAIQTGLPPRHADPYGAAAPGSPGEAPEVPPVPTAAPQPPPGQQPANPAQPGGSAEASPWTTVLTIAGAVAVVVLIAAVVLWVRRRDRARDTHLDAEAAWARLRAELPSELRWPLTLTPHEAADHVDEEMRRIGDGLTGAGRESLTRLQRAVEDLRYSPSGSDATAEDLRTWADAVAGEAAKNERSTAGSRSGSLST